MRRGKSDENNGKNKMKQETKDAAILVVKNLIDKTKKDELRWINQHGTFTTTLILMDRDLTFTIWKHNQNYTYGLFGEPKPKRCDIILMFGDPEVRLTQYISNLGTKKQFSYGIEGLDTLFDLTAEKSQDYELEQMKVLLDAKTAFGKEIFTVQK
jgi:hypothetical protein